MAATIDIVAKFSDQASAGVQALTQTVTASQQQMTRMGEAAGTAGRAGVQDLLDQISSLRTRLGELSGATKPSQDALGSLVGTIGTLGGAIAGMIPTITVWAAAITAAVVVFRQVITALAEWSVATEKTTVNLTALGVTEAEGARLAKQWGDQHKRAEEAAKDYASALAYAGKAADERAVAEARASGNVLALIDAELQKKREAIEREKQDRIKAGEDRVLVEQGAHDRIIAADLEAAGKRQKAFDALKQAQTEAAQARVAAETEASGNVLEVIRVELAEKLAAIDKEREARIKAGDERATVEQIAADKRIAAETQAATKLEAALKPHLDAATKAANERALAEAKASGNVLRVIKEETRQKLAAVETEKQARTKALGDSVLAEKIAADQRATIYTQERALTQEVAKSLQALPFGALPEEFELIRRSIEGATDAAIRHAEQEADLARRGAEGAQAVGRTWEETARIWKTSGVSVNELGAAIVRAGEAGEAAGEKTARGWQRAATAAKEAGTTFTEIPKQVAKAGDDAVRVLGTVSGEMYDTAGKVVKQLTGDVVSFMGIMTQEAKTRLAELARIQRIEAAEAKIRHAEFLKNLAERERALGWRSVSQEEIRRREETTNVNVNVNAGRLAQGITVEQERQTQRRAGGRSGYTEPGTGRTIWYD
jgi:hypothetical protein